MPRPQQLKLDGTNTTTPYPALPHPSFAALDSSPEIHAAFLVTWLVWLSSGGWQRTVTTCFPFRYSREAAFLWSRWAAGQGLPATFAKEVQRIQLDLLVARESAPVSLSTSLKLRGSFQGKQTMAYNHFLQKSWLTSDLWNLRNPRTSLRRGPFQG